MLFLLYNFFLCLFLLCGWPLLLVYMYQRQGSLAGLDERLALGLKPLAEDGCRGAVTWFHGASVGEIRMLLPLVEAWCRSHPADRLLVTTMTVTGRETARQLFPTARVRLLPFDLPWVWKRFFAVYRPARLVIAETELWPNLLRSAGVCGLPVALVNARLSQNSFRSYRRFAFFTRRMFAVPGLVVAQDHESGCRFTALGTPAERVVLCGNMKFDIEFGAARKAYRELLPPDSFIVVAGSTHPGEEAMLLAAWERALDKFSGPAAKACLVLAPRHPQRFSEIAAWLAGRGAEFVSFAEFKRKREPAALRLAPLPRVLLLDTLGDLAAFYPLGGLAVIGGTLVPGIGGHNPLEAAVCGRAVIHGPHVSSFRDGFRCLDEQGGGLPVADAAELEKLLLRFLEEPAWARREGLRALETMRRQRGAVACTLAHLENLFAASKAGTR